ncbi:hypothetical protein [Sphingobacterium hungaricum]
MRFTSALVLLVVIGLGFVTSCIRDDAEPASQDVNNARLYFSTLEYQTNTAVAAYNNAYLISPPDSPSFENISLSFNSGARGGSVIYFDRNLQMVFHSSQNNLGDLDTTIYGLSVGTTGVLSSKSKIGNRLFQSIKGMAYDLGEDRLYAYDNISKAIYVTTAPRSKINYAAIVTSFMLQNISGWALSLVGPDMFMTKTGANGGIAIFENITSKTNATYTAFTPDHTITIDGSSNIRGISYDTVKDVLVLTDYELSGNESIGKIYIFENFKDSKDQSTLVPTRTITGAATGLLQPMDVAIDNRSTGKFIWVADQRAKKILRFNISDNGNVEPDAAFNSTYTPVSLALDTR